MTWKPRGKAGTALIKAAERKGTGTLTVAQLSQKAAAKTRRTLKPGISVACKDKHHGQCYKLNCECECHPKC